MKNDTEGITVANPGWKFDAEEAKHAHRRRPEFIRHLREHASSGSDFAAAEIIYGELVSNVVRYANGRISIVLEWELAFAVLRVRDFGKGFEHDFHLPHSASESGRGLFIVHKLARKLEIEARPTGSEVRATLPVWMAA
jgi:anti-sigma regulatory factor (Ser/Thr protein kinase)